MSCSTVQYQTRRANRMWKGHKKEEGAKSLMTIGIVYQTLCVKIGMHPSSSFSRQMSSSILLN
jgi:hypothetical protein